MLKQLYNAQMERNFQNCLYISLGVVLCVNGEISPLFERSVRLKSGPSGAGQDELSQLGRKASSDASHPQTDGESPPLQGGVLQERDWERWQDDEVSQIIHEFWMQSSYEQSHREALAQLVKSLYLPGERFLEAGCGSGLVYKQLVPRVMDNSSYTGIDITQAMLDMARKDYPNGVFQKDDLYNLLFQDNSFEIVAAFEVLGHLPNIEIPIREMFRVASRLVVFTVWTSRSTFIAEEKFKNSTFIHTEFSHPDIMEAIKNATDGECAVKTISLHGHTVAYVISKTDNNNREE